MYEKVRLSSYRFLSWLILKLQAVGTEEEALERILSSRIPQNVPKIRQRGSRICLMELRGMDLRPQSSMPLCSGIQEGGESQERQEEGDRHHHQC